MQGCICGLAALPNELGHGEGREVVLRLAPKCTPLDFLLGALASRPTTIMLHVSVTYSG